MSLSGKLSRLRRLWLIWILFASAEGLAGRKLQLGRPDGPPQKIVISNESPVPDAWVVHELELFFGFCGEPSPDDFVAFLGAGPARGSV